MEPRHESRFATQILPSLVFDDPPAFARAAADPLRCAALLASAWERAGQTRSPGGLSVAIVRADPHVLIHVEPPFPIDGDDACAIAIVGRGDALEDARCYTLELGVDTTGATRFVLMIRTPDRDVMNLGEAAPDVEAFLEQCLAHAAGAKPAARERAPVVAPWYWWHVARGAEAVRAFHAAPEHEAWSVVHRYPVLLLPEIADAADHVFGPSRATDGLRQMQRALRGTPYFVPFYRLLATTLGGERGGSQRVNLERALAVMAELHTVGAEGVELGRVHACEAVLREGLASIGVDARRNYEAALELYRAAREQPAEPADREADERAAQAIRAALGAQGDPTWLAMFLDDTDLAGYELVDDRRGEGPQREDAAFALRGGVSAGSAIWQGDEAWPVHAIADTRWLFPSAKTANAFVEAIAPITGDGLSALPAPKLGDLAHAWGAIRGPKQIVLVRVGRLVAKLVVTEGTRAAKQFQVLAHAMVTPYAEAVVRRGRWALSRYWLAIAQGIEAANRFVQAPARGAGRLIAQYPILLLPEFPSAMASLGESHRAAAEALAHLQASFKNDWTAYRDAMRALVRTLLDERNGEPVVNADAALALVVGHRRVDSDYAWAAIEAECRERSAIIRRPS